MIWNIIDRRKRPYRWKRVQAIVELVSNDNSVKDSDQYASTADERAWIGYDERDDISLAHAVQWAQALPYPVTLFLYDPGQGTKEATSRD